MKRVVVFVSISVFLFPFNVSSDGIVLVGSAVDDCMLKSSPWPLFS